MEKSEKDNFHIHVLLTFSTGSHRAFTILESVTLTLKALDGVKSAIAFPRKPEKQLFSNQDLYKLLSNDNEYFHDLVDIHDFRDAVLRYSYLSKYETKDSDELVGIRLTQSKKPLATKTKREQKKRKLKLKKELKKC